MPNNTEVLSKPPRDPPRYLPQEEETEVKVKKYTSFFLLTYLPPDDVWLELQAHQSQIKRFALALHDKDTWSEDVYHVDPETKEYILDENGLPSVKYHSGSPKEPHVHLFLELKNGQSRTVSCVANWFKEFHGENTFCRAVTSNPGACWKYLIHDSEECRREGKFQYTPDIRVTNDPQYFNRFDLPFQGDKILNALFDLEAGFSYRECCMKYGRDFILNFRHIRDMLDHIKTQERPRKND